MNYVMPSPLYSPARSVISPSSSGKGSTLVVDDPGTRASEKAGETKYSWTMLAMCVVTTSLTSLLLGYDVGIMSAALPLMRESLELTSFQVGVIAGGLNFIAGVGSVPFGILADWLGRRTSMIWACVVFATGTALMSGSTDFVVLLIARAAMGLGVGATFVIAPVYLSELVPAEVRGALVCCFDICINVGILLGFAGGYLIDTGIDASADFKWRLMIGVGVIPPVAIALAAQFLPRSPRWLVSHGLRAEAEFALSRVVPDARHVAEEMESMIQATMKENSASYAQVIFPRTKSMQRALHITMGLSILQQITGSEAAILFTPMILRGAGVTSTSTQLLWALPVGVAKLLGELISVPLLDRVGRRPLLIAGGFMQFICLLGLTVAFIQRWHWQYLILIISGFMLSFEIGAPIAWLMPSEVYNSGSRGRAQSISVTVNRIVSGLLLVSFPVILELVGPPLVFGTFAALALFSVVWYHLVIPETAGLSLEEITTLLREESFGHLSEASQFAAGIRSYSVGSRLNRAPRMFMSMSRPRGYGTLQWAAANESKHKGEGNVALPVQPRRTHSDPTIPGTPTTHGGRRRF
uniref:Hexose transporter 1 n=1 Tax=Lotharella globosa TaxID=91324 RepID=A0A7S3YWI4_9EUKA|mmetsp:Transcript_17696/g.35705  ORF Transcript_17696/g.35705 Transcript_17696/m.35705 type:complete len:582 (+) Transcript_17696:143-1888(+)